MSGVDLYSPWREGPSALSRRNVGRERELDAIRAAARAFAGGSSPLPLYLFGAHGIGKSHLLTLAIQAVEAVTLVAEVAITVVPEDAIAMRSAAMLFDVMMGGIERQPWMVWEAAPRHPHDHRRRVVLFEGLDRQLRALGIQGRRELRRLLGDAPDLWIVGAGMTLPDELTAADEAFFAAFDPWPLDALTDDEAGELLDRMAMESAHDAAWRRHRATLLTMAGGNPRMVVALGRLRRRDRRSSSSELVRRVVHQFTPQHRNKLRDLAPQAQRIVTQLASTPRELGPSELGTRIESTTTQMSVQARRLVDDGVLRHRSDGRQTWYRLADSSFRFWLEYRHARWTETRAGWAAKLIEALQPSAPPPLGAELARPWRALETELSLRPLSRARAQAALEQAAALPADAEAESTLIGVALTHDLGALIEVHFPLRAHHARDVAALATLDRSLRTQAVPPREAFMRFVGELVAPRPRTASILCHVLARAAYGRPWALRGSEKKALAGHPFVRALFLGQGRAWAHAPLLHPKDVVDAVERDPPDAVELLVEAMRWRHAELLRHAARALLRAEQTLPPCPSLHVLDAESADAIAALMLLGLRRGDTVAQGWLASVADADDKSFQALVVALAEVPLDGDAPATELALTKLAHHHPQRFEQLAGASQHRPACAAARLLRAQLAERERGDLHPELDIIGRALDATEGTRS